MASNPDATRGGRSTKAAPAPTADAVPATKADASAERKFLGKYKIEKTLGAGGMGAVYLATDMELRRQVALKILPKDKAENPRLLARFKSEAEAAAQLQHENIVAVWDRGMADGQHYIAMEYIEGNDVHQLMNKRGIIPVRRSIEIITQVALALQHAWKKKIVHRDIKPSNLLVRRDGVVKLADLGLARAVDDTMETGITRAGTTVGTVDYMAPEQARDSKAADIRSDIYSLGCTWYHMLTGQVPYPDGALTNKLHAHAVKPPPDPRTLNDHVPDGVVAVIHRMMAKKPEDRYQDPTELLDDMRQSALGRENVSNSVLAALAQADSADDVPAAASRQVKSPEPPPVEAVKGDGEKKKRKAPPRGTVPAAAFDDNEEAAAPAAAKSARRSGPHALPPKDDPRKKKKADGEEEDESKPNGDDDRKKALLKYLAIGAVAIAAFGLMAYVSNQMSSVLDTQGPRTKNPFENADASGNPTAAGQGGQAGPGGKKPDGVKVTDPKTATNDPFDPRTLVNSQSGNDSAAPVAKITIGRDNERDQMPRWIASLPTRNDIAQLEKAKIPVFSVGRAATDKPSQFNTLAEAFAAVPNTGGLVQLHGAGPFYLRPTELVGKTRLIIAGAEGSRTVIMLLPEPNGSGRQLLRVRRMALELLGVHVTAVARQFPATDELTLIDARSADLSIRQSSVTLQGTRPGATFAIRVSDEPAGPDGKPQPPPHVLFDRSIVRGDRFVPLASSSAAVDAVVSGSLFVSGEAPALSVKDPPPAAPRTGAEKAAESKSTDGKPNDPDTGAPKAPRSFRYFSSTLCSAAPAFDLAPANADSTLPAVSLLAMNCVVASSRPEPNSALFDLGPWPVATDLGDDKPLFRSLSAEAPTTLLVGWKSLFASKSDTASGAAGAAGWKRVFQTDLLEGQFQSKPWPGRMLDNLGTLAPGELDTASLESATVKPEGGGFCGAKTADLSIPSDETLVRTDAMADRPFQSAIIQRDASAATNVMSIDATKEDLGKAVSNGSWKSGATIKVIGTNGNVAKSTPISLKGRSARLEIDPALTIESRDIDFKGSNPPEAFLSTGGGSLEIVGGKFRILASTKGELPKWLIHVENGGFSLDNVQLLGPVLASSNKFEGLIRWTRPAAEPVKALPAGHYGQHGVIRNSYLASEKKALYADLRGRALSLQNSACVSLEQLFDLNISGADGRVGAVVDLQDTTLSAVAGVFNIRAASLAGPAESPLRFFSDRCAFVSSVDVGSPPRPWLMSHAAAARDQKQLEWWAFSNAYGDEFRVWRKVDGAVPGDQDFDRDWAGGWGPGHESRPLIGRGVATTKGGYKQKSKLSPADFEVDVNSPAGKWTLAGGPVGPQLGVPAEAAPPATASASPTPAPNPGKTAPKPNTVKPNF